MEYFSKPGICGARVERSGRLIKLIYCAITQVVRFGICLIAWEVAWVAIDFEVMTLPGISFILTTINVLLDVFYLCFLYWEGFSNLELEIIENSDFFSTKWCRVIRKIVFPTCHSSPCSVIFISIKLNTIFKWMGSHCKGSINLHFRLLHAIFTGWLQNYHYEFSRCIEILLCRVQFLSKTWLASCLTVQFLSCVVLHWISTYMYVISIESVTTPKITLTTVFDPHCLFVVRVHAPAS